MSLVILSLACSLKTSVVEAAPVPLASITPSSSPSDISISSPLLKRRGTSPATDRMSAPNFCNLDSYSDMYCNQSNYNPSRQSSNDSGSSSSSGYNRDNVPSSSSSGGNNGGNSGDYKPVQDNSRRE
ncbi:hypothetical protein BGZ82_001607 [Podila clonocystis]|nr:hypothetical protein BGZ82_001607 [Podila clonocystis]